MSGDAVAEILAKLAEVQVAIARVEERVAVVPVLQTQVAELQRARWRMAGAGTLAGAAIAAIPAWVGLHR